MGTTWRFDLHSEQLTSSWPLSSPQHASEPDLRATHLGRVRRRHLGTGTVLRKRLCDVRARLHSCVL